MRLNIELKHEIYEELRGSAEAEGRSISDVVRVLINEWLRTRQVREIRVAKKKVAGESR
jgi:predicted CopG family antitoxin